MIAATTPLASTTSRWGTPVFVIITAAVYAPTPTNAAAAKFTTPA